MTRHVILRALARRISYEKRSFTFVQDDKNFGSFCKDAKKSENVIARSFATKQSIKSPIKCIQTGTSKRKWNIISWIASLSLAMTPFGTFRDDNVLKKKAAFTLAEVLITLGIIGVVAAMTLPTLIAKYQEKVWLTQFKVTYSTLSQAYLRAYQEHGVIKNWGLPLDNKAESAKIVAEKLLPYLNLAQDFKQNSNHSSHNLPMHYLGLNGKELGTNFNGWESAHYIFALANGAVGGISDIGIDEVDGRFRVQTERQAPIKWGRISSFYTWVQKTVILS